MNLSFVDWIWRIKGKVEIDRADTPDQAFARLEDLFAEKNTQYAINGDILTFTKKNAVPQDKMSVFDKGTLHISGGVLRYDLISRALLACFLAPLLFYGLGHAGVAFDKWRNPPEVAKAKAEAAKRHQLVKPEDVPMHPVDKFLGAPTPEKKKDGEEMGKRNRKPSMTTAYTYMGIFFALWIIGRLLEHKLIHDRFRKRLLGEQRAEITVPVSDSGIPLISPAQAG